MPGKHDQLTERQATFIRLYLTGPDACRGNATECYRRSYNSSKTSEKILNEEACKLLKHPKIIPIIAAAEAKAAVRLDKTLDRYAISKERIAVELARMAFADPRRYFTWSAAGVDVRDSAGLTDDEAAAVVEVSHTRTARGSGTIHIKLGDKRGALMDLARLYGYEAVRNLRLIKGVEDLSDDEIAALLAGDGESERNGTRH